VINLPATDSPALLQFTATRLIQHFGDDKAGALGDLLAPALSLADMSYRANLWVSTAPNERTAQGVSLQTANKRHEEFCADMLPLLNKLRKQPNGKHLLCWMWALASKEGTPEDPRGWLPATQQSLYHEHFRHFIEHTDSGFRFNPSSFSELLLEFTTEDGETKEPAPTDVRLFTHNQDQLNLLWQVAGEQLKEANKTPAPDLFFDAMEQATAAHFARKGWVLSPSFAEDYDPEKEPSSSADRAFHSLLAHHNHGIVKQLKGLLPRPHCAMLLAFRHAYLHYVKIKEKDKRAKRLQQLVMDCVPPGLRELVTSLQDVARRISQSS
jgi:hypothetical protein